jgi:hypothetical protein
VRPSSPRNRTAIDLAALALGGATLLIALILWLDNAQGGLTGNGVFKAFQLKPWVVDPSHAKLDPSNYLYFPVYGSLCRLLDALGVFAQDPRRQITILNALCGALCLCITYLLARAVTGQRAVALLAALFHLCCNFVLFLAIINEDIMPSYTLLYAAMAMAGVWFACPTAGRVVAVAVVFTTAWLFEWRLMFPTLPAMLAALLLCEKRKVVALGWIALFVATMLAVAGAVALAWQGHDGAVGLSDLLWTGKGVGSVWGGFTWIKLWYMWDGLSGYLLGAGVAAFPNIPGWDIWRFTASIFMLAVAAVSLTVLWRRRESVQTWALLAVFGGTFVAGEVFNAYSQPQDPQMQINVMPWLTVGWALVLAAATARWGRRALAALAGVSLLLLANNVWSLAPYRGVDSGWTRALDNIERQADPARTVFLLLGIDWPMIYMSLHWSYTPQGIDTLGPAPQTDPKFKWIGFLGEILLHPEWTTEQHVARLRGELNRAFDLGYDVVVSQIWNWQLWQLESASGMVADRGTLEALHHLLHSEYTVRPLLDDPTAGPYFRLERAPRP